MDVQRFRERSMVGPGCRSRSGTRGRRAAVVATVVVGCVLSACSAPPPPATATSPAASGSPAGTSATPARAGGTTSLARAETSLPPAPAGSVRSTAASAPATSSGVPAAVAAAPVHRKKLVEIGYDTPDAVYVRDHVREIEKLPFDGIALTPRQTPVLFENRSWTADDTQIPVFSAIKWKKFTDNYISVWAQSPSGAGWFDDARWNRISLNARKLSHVVAAARARGIIFDPEFYYKNPQLNHAWRYDRARFGGRGFAAVEAQVRKRGATFMASLQSKRPGVKVMIMHGLSNVYGEMVYDRKGRSQVEYALLPAFVNGMLDAAGPAVQIIDGNENGYYYREAKNFTDAAAWTRNESIKLVDPRHRARYRRSAMGMAVSPDCAFGLWPAPTFEICQRGNLSPAGRRKLLQDNTYRALRTVDEVAWFYNEAFELIRPTAADHPGEPRPVKGLDRKAVIDAVVAARKRLATQTP